MTKTKKITEPRQKLTLEELHKRVDEEQPARFYFDKNEFFLEYTAGYTVLRTWFHTMSCWCIVEATKNKQKIKDIIDIIERTGNRGYKFER